MSAGPYQITTTLPPQAAEDDVERMLSRGQRRRYRLWRTPSLFIGGGIVLFLVVIAIFAPLIAPAGPNHAFDDGLNAFGQPRSPFSGHFLLGTDSGARDVLSRLIYGAQVSLFVAVVANALSMTVSILVGLLAGYVRGPLETVLMRLTDLMMSLPSLLLAMTLIVVFQPGLFMVIVAIVLVNWTYLARVVYGEVVSLREREFVEAARAVGAGRARIMARHIFPHLVGLSIVYFALNSSHLSFVQTGKRQG